MNFKHLSRVKLRVLKAVTQLSSFSVLRPFSLFICLTISAAFAAAGQLKTELRFVLPKKDLVQEALRQSGTLNFQRESLTFSSEFPVHLKTINLNFDYRVQALTPVEAGRFTTRVEVTKVDARAAELKIDSVLEVETSGVRAKIPIRAQCRGVRITNQKPLYLELQGQVREKPRLTLALENVDWERVGGVWAIAAEHCEAAPGFTTFLTEQLAKIWIESRDLPGYIFEDANRELGAWFSKSLTLQKEVPELDSRVELRGQSFQDAGSAWVFGIEMSVDANVGTQNACGTLNEDIYLPMLGQSAEAPGPEIWANEKLVALWAKCLHERGRLTREDRGREISGFQRLMSSRFLQFFVWPDLMQYPKDTDFHFMTSSYGTFSLEPRPVSSGASFRIQTQIASRMVYPEAGRWAPYMTFYTPVRADLRMSVQDSKLKIQSASTPQTKLNYRFDAPASYSRSIGISTIESEVKDFLAAEIFELELPRLPLTSDITAQAVGLRRENQTLKIRLQRVGESSEP